MKIFILVNFRKTSLQHLHYLCIFKNIFAGITLHVLHTNSCVNRNQKSNEDNNIFGALSKKDMHCDLCDGTNDVNNDESSACIRTSYSLKCLSHSFTR